MLLWQAEAEEVLWELAFPEEDQVARAKICLDALVPFLPRGCVDLGDRSDSAVRQFPLLFHGLIHLKSDIRRQCWRYAFLRWTTSN